MDGKKPKIVKVEAVKVSDSKTDKTIDDVDYVKLFKEFENEWMSLAAVEAVTELRMGKKLVRRTVTRYLKDMTGAFKSRKTKKGEWEIHGESLPEIVKTWIKRTKKTKTNKKDSETNKLRAELSERAFQIGALTSQLSDLQTKQLPMLNGTIKEVKDENTVLKSEIKEVENNKSRLEGKLEVLEPEHKELKIKLDEADKKLDETLKNAEVKEKAISEELAALESELKKLQSHQIAIPKFIRKLFKPKKAA